MRLAMSGEYDNFLNGHSPDDGLVKLALADVQKSGLASETLERAGVKIFQGDKNVLKDRLGFASINGQPLLKVCRLVEFPYFDEEGTLISYIYKLIPSIADKQGKEIRYLHAKDKPALPYILPAVWDIKDKPHKPAWISEGVKKALALLQYERCCIALPGAWNFKAGQNSEELDNDKNLWAELEFFQWQGRTVYLAFDSDLWTNPSVRSALYELSCKLYERGGIVKIVTWDKEKGIDDFLVLQNEPDNAVTLLENKAINLLDFLNADHRPEIMRAISLIKGEIGRELLIKAFAKKSGISVKAVRSHIQLNESKSETQSRSELFPEIDPWPDPVNGAELLDEIRGTLNRYCILPRHAAETITLWVLYTHTIDASFTAPILALESAEKRCGKTTALSVLSQLCHRALMASNISPASTFRAIDKWQPTLIVDEADSFLKENEALRGILNSGHTRSCAFVIRTVGDDHEPKQFKTWGPKVIALIGNLPATLTDRSIVIKMFRKRRDEQIEKLKKHLTDFKDLQRKCLRWASDNIEALKKADPNIPLGLHDRATDNWTPLLAIADLAGGEWPKMARRAAVALSDCNGEDDTAGVMLLKDIRDYLEETGADRCVSADLCYHLAKMEERPWPEWSKGKPITTRQVAKLLNPFGIIPNTIRVGNEIHKGYKKDAFIESLSRYLPSTPISSVTSLQSSTGAGLSDISSVTQETMLRIENDGKSSIHAGCNDVTDKKGGMGENNEIFTNLGEGEIDMEVEL